MGINNPSGTSQIWTLLHDETLVATGRFDISGLSQTHSMIEWHLFGRSDVSADSDNILCHFNGDTTSTNYRFQQSNFRASATFIEGDGERSAVVTAATATANYFSSTIGTIENYANATFFKQLVSRSGHRRNATDIHQDLFVMHWESTDAINQITLQPDGYSTDEFIIGTRLQIFGVN